ncbi:MAG: heme-binding domain-containing protein [Lentimicrobiaceae bacterium]|nr:heme-binding domain-containing protein [Lentimicrobiaceae bacterium]
MGEEVSKGEMPLKSYSRMHRKARLSAAQREQLSQWIDLESARLIGQ